MNGVKTFLCYGRVSTLGQSDSSIELQHRYLTAYAKTLDGYDIQTFSEKASGKDIDGRPVLREMIEKSEAGDIIGFYDNSRLGRSTEDNLSIAKTLHDKGVGLFIEGRIIEPNNPNQKLMLSIESSISTYYRESQNAKSRAGVDIAKEKGEWIFTGRLYGFSLEHKHGKPIVSFIEKEAKVIRMIFDDYERGESTLAISKWLNKNGYRTREGKMWSAAQIRRIILKPIYAGIYMLDGPGPQTNYSSLKLNPKNMVKSKYYQPIIDEQQFWRVYNSHRKVTRKHARQFEYRWTAYPLSSVIRCDCGKSYIHTFTKRGNSVRSNYRPTNKHDEGCNSLPTTIRASIWEPLFQNIVYLSFLWSNDILAQLLLEKQDVLNRHKNIEDDVERIDSQIKTVKTKVKNIINAIEQGVEIIDMKNRLDELKQEQDDLEIQKKKLTIAVMNDEEQLEAMADAITDEALLDFASGSVQEQRLYYLENLTAVISHYSLHVKFSFGLTVDVPLKKHHARTVQEKFELHVSYNGFKHVFHYKDGLLTSDDRMMQERLNTIYRDLHNP